MDDPRLWLMVIGSVVGSGGGAWAAIRVHLHYINRRVDGVQESVRRAHERIDGLLTRG